MRRFVARLAISIALILIALVAVMIAVGYFIFALYLWLSEYFVPPAAAVIAGLIVLVVAVILALISRMTMRSSRGPQGQRGRDFTSLGATESAAELGTLLGDKLQGFANMGRGTSMLTALAAGFAIGLSPKLRGLLWRLLKKLT